MDIQVGDLITYINSNDSLRMRYKSIMINSDRLIDYKNKLENKEIEIIKIERPKYEVIQEKKELLTEEEKEFLKSYIKIIKSLNNGQIEYIARYGVMIVVHLKTKLSYDADIGPRFKGMIENKTYTLEELGLN